MSNTLLALAQAVSAEIGDLETGTATSGSTTTLIDTSDDSPFTGADGSSLFADSWVYVNAGSNVGVERRASSYTPGSLELTFGNAYSASIDDTSGYEVRRLISRSKVVAAINKVLTRKLYYYTIEPIGLLADGDGAMEDTDTSSWVGTNATLTKESSENDFFYGAQSLRLDATATGGYAESRIVLVRPGEALRAQALCLPYLVSSNKSSASLVIRDQDNSADVSLGGTVTASYTTDGPIYKRLWSNFSVPSGCGRITFRLTEGTNGARCFWDDLALVRKEQRMYQLPSWCDNEEYFEWVWMLVEEGESSSLPFQRRFRPVQQNAIQAVQHGNGFSFVEVSGDAVGQFLYVSGFRHYPSLSSDSDSTNAPLAWLLAAAIVEVLTPLVNDADDRDNTRLKEKLAFWSQQLAIAEAEAPDFQYQPAFRLSLSGR